MPMDRPTAKELHAELQQLSWKVLDAAGCLREPHKPKVRTLKWHDNEGPSGIAFHYTGGPSGLKSMRWFNHPGWGNNDSSAQFLVFDRMTENEVGDVWDHESQISNYFPVPTVMLADTRWGTWCTNWANDHAMGVENRNVGYNAEHLPRTGKQPVEIAGVRWEPYTREQLICNINLGRLFRALRGEKFDPDWIVGHSMIHGPKRDPGANFPMHAMRDAIFGDQAVEELAWLEGYPLAPAKKEDDAGEWEGDRDPGLGEEIELLSFGLPKPVKDPAELASLLYPLGYNVGDGVPDDAKLRKFATWFQKSTQAFRKTKPARVISVDGDPGPGTRKALRERLKELRLEPRPVV